MKNAITKACANYLNTHRDGNNLIEVKLHRVDGHTALYDIDKVAEMVELGDHLGLEDSLEFTFAHTTMELHKNSLGDLIMTPVKRESLFSKYERQFNTNQSFRYWKLRHDVASLLGVDQMTPAFHKAFNKDFDEMVVERECV